MFDNFGALDASVQEILEKDTDFQSTLTDLSEEDKAEAIKTKKSELLDIEIKGLSKNKELADNYKTRAEKAEGELKKKKPTEEPKTDGDLSSMDTIAIINAKVSSEDIEDVVEYAKFKKITVVEALKSSIVKTMLEEKEEKRKSAEATSTGKARAGQGKVSDETVLSNMAKGDVPEPGSAEAEQLFWARRKKKK